MNRNTATSITLSPTTKAAVLILVSTALFSTLPLFVALFGVDSPFIFSSVWRVGRVVILVAVMFLLYRDLILDGNVWRLSWQRSLSLPMLCWMVQQFDYALFAVSARFIDISITAVIYETWPIMMVALMSWLFKEELRYQRIGGIAYLAFILAVFGVGVVLLSKSDSLAAVLGQSTMMSPLDWALGVAFALAAACSTAMGAFGFRWAADFAEALPGTATHSPGSREMFCVMLGTVLSGVFAIPLMALLGFARNEPIVFTTLTWALIVIPVVAETGTLSWRWGNLVTERLGVNVISYFTPLLSLSLLLMFGQVGDVNLTFLFIGAGAIVFANLMVFLHDAQSSKAEAEGVDKMDVTDLIAAGESDTVEFKSSLRVNLYTKERDTRMESTALKTLAAFLNSGGGTLIIGVADDKTPVGIGIDEFPNEDRMSLHLRNIVTGRMGALAMSHISPSFHDYQGERVMALRCEPSDQAVYLQEANNVEKFYIRTGPSTTELSISEATAYMNNRF